MKRDPFTSNNKTLMLMDYNFIIITLRWLVVGILDTIKADI